MGVDYIYRKYDRGTTTYTIGTEPGGPQFPIAQIYVPAAGGYTDPITGVNAPYYVVCSTCTRPSGVGNITVTNPNYQIYKGVDITANKRFSSNWQMSAALTLQTNPNYYPRGSGSFDNPTGQDFLNGVSTVPTYLLKMNGAYQFPYDITASANFNYYQGGTRTVTIDGPGDVFGGGTSVITYSTLEFQPRDSFRYKPTRLLDIGLQKAFRFRGGKNRVKLMLDGFNMFNVNTIQGYASNNMSVDAFSSPDEIIPPRVFRIGASIQF